MTADKEITQNEKESIDELRNRIKGDMDTELYNDTYLFLRFLKARDFNLNNAEAMLRKHLEWRKKYDVENILKCKRNEIMEKHITNVILGYDKEGCVIRYSPVGSLDFIGIIASCPLDDIMKFIIFEQETETAEHKKQSEKLGRNIDKTVYIYDYKNLSFATATDKKVLYASICLLNIFINNYPERLKAAYLFNVSIYFTMMYSVAKTMLPKSILNKIHIYSDDSYKEDLLKVIDADVLPTFLGGNRTDADGNPLCLTIVRPPEPVPKNLYLQKSKKTLSKTPGVKKVTLSRASFHEVNLEVKEAGSYLEWEFETKCRDIGFGLFYSEVVDGEEKITELVSIQRIDTESYPETGTYLCEHPGTYVIVFDNTYSWVRAKEIYYRTKVVSPAEHESEIKE